MINLSVMPLDIDHIEEVSEDIIEQQRSGATTHAIFMMKFNPEGTPAANKAEEQCRRYDMFRERLDRAGAKHGVLVQATLGHIIVPSSPYPFQPTVFLETGEDRVVTCCPLDPDFREYIRGQFRILAAHRPSLVMIDDDVGLLYKQSKGCACKYHMAELRRRLGRDINREELCLRVVGDSEEDKRCTSAYVEVVRDSLVGCVEAMRAGLDDVDPTIQGIVSGIYTSTFCEFSGEIAQAFAGKGNPSIVRLNGGPYATSCGTGGARRFTSNMFRAAILKENTKGKVDIYLAETDTCPQNRYSTSAAQLHAHFTASILEGAEGAKHWITRLTTHEPTSGRAYRRKLSKYSKFYEALVGYYKQLTPFGCRIPLTLMQRYGFVPQEFGVQLSPWSTAVLERMGIPMYFGNFGDGVVFVDDFSVKGFTDDEIREFMKGTLVLSVGAADELVKRGFASELGVKVGDTEGKLVVSAERMGTACMTAQYGRRELIPLSDKIEWLSEVFHRDAQSGDVTPMYPGVSRNKTSFGGSCIVFSGTPDAPFTYCTAFSMLNETRKKQIIGIIKDSGELPLYYPEDAEVYIRAGRLSDGRMLVALFNLSWDALEDIPLVVENSITRISELCEDGELRERSFTSEGGLVRIERAVSAMEPCVLIME